MSYFQKRIKPRLNLVQDLRSTLSFLFSKKIKKLELNFKDAINFKNNLKQENPRKKQNKNNFLSFNT